jgi:hypothetical protein
MSKFLRAKNAGDIAKILSVCDAEMLQLIAQSLVCHDYQKADQLQFALNTEIHELLMDHGFSEKINQEAA